MRKYVTRISILFGDSDSVRRARGLTVVTTPMARPIRLALPAGPRWHVSFAGVCSLRGCEVFPANLVHMLTLYIAHLIRPQAEVRRQAHVR